MKALNKLPLIILGVFLLSLGVLSYYAHAFDRFPYDLAMALRVQSLSSPSLSLIMKGVSALGRDHITAAIIVAVALAFWLMRKRLWSLFVLLAGIFNLLNKGVKFLVDRPRPTPELVQVLDISPESSFPSGHAVNAMVFFGFLFFLASTSVRNRAARTTIQVFLGLLIALTGFSRVYLGAHWPSDVFGGYLFGGLYLFLLMWGYKKAASYREPTFLKKAK